MRLDVALTLVSASTCAPLSGYAVHIRACDREGRNSLYSNGVTNQNYQRGVQAGDAVGTVRFTMIYLGCCSGRWPHLGVIRPQGGLVGGQRRTPTVSQ